MHIKVVVPFYNVESTIEKTIASIQNQTESKFECVLVDDGSSDRTVSIIQSKIQKDSRFHLIQQVINKGSALANIVDGFNFINPEHDSICIMIDGDDWLINQYVFQRLLDCYRLSDTQLTYGQYITYPDQIQSNSQPLPDWVIRQNLYRCVYPFFLTPIRSFKGELWQKLDQQDLRANDGHFFSSACDAAIMFSLAELANGKITFIDEPLYVYNRTTPYHNDQIHPNLQRNMMLEIRSKQTSCNRRLSEQDRWKMINENQLNELLAIEHRVMISFDKVGKSFFNEPFNAAKHSEILQRLAVIS